MEIDEMIKELNESRPKAYFHGIPVYAKNFVSQGEIWFIKKAKSGISTTPGLIEFEEDDT